VQFFTRIIIKINLLTCLLTDYILLVCRTGPSGMLTLFSPRGDAASGKYRCQVSDGVTSQSRDYYVTVQRQWLFIDPASFCSALTTRTLLYVSVAVF